LYAVLISESWPLLILMTGHVNNLYNTTFWNMVKGNPVTDTPAMTPTEAELALKVSLASLWLLFPADTKKGTFSKDKHEILFQKFKLNYDKEDEIWKKGSVVYRRVGSFSLSYLVDANKNH